MAQFTFNFGFFKAEFTEKELASLIEIISNIFRKRINRIKINVDLIKALSIASKYINNDRITEGEVCGGKGGWGNSMGIWYKDIYNYDEGRDSIWNSYNAILATYYLNNFTRIQKENNIFIYSNEIDNILEEFRLYIMQRWNEKTGEAGLLIRTSTMGRAYVPDYRHTCHALRIWLSLNGYRENINKTVEYLRNNYQNKLIPHEHENRSIADYVGCYLAMDLIEKENLENNNNEVKTIKSSAEDIIKFKYLNSINGWTNPSAVSDDVIRNAYTLFVIAEICQFMNKKEILNPQTLTFLLDKALQVTIDSCWEDEKKSMIGVPLIWNQEETLKKPRVDLSCLLLSALMRKPQNTLSRKEKQATKKVLKFITTSLVSDPPEYLDKNYSWAVSYFVTDICREYLIQKGKWPTSSTF